MLHVHDPITWGNFKSLALANKLMTQNLHVSYFGKALREIVPQLVINHEVT